MKLMLRLALSVYVGVSLGALQTVDWTSKVHACAPTGNYVLTINGISDCTGVDGYVCNCKLGTGGTTYSGSLSKLVANTPGSDQTGEPADPEGGELSCTKQVTCKVLGTLPVECTLTVFGGTWNCVGDYAYWACSLRAPVVPDAWGTIKQASTCD